MKTRICLTAVLLFLAVALAEAANGYYQTSPAPGQGWLQITNSTGEDLSLTSDPASRSLYLTAPDPNAIYLANANSVTLAMDESEWTLYGDGAAGLPVSIHPGFTTSLQLSQTAYGGTFGVMGTVDDGRYHRTGQLYTYVPQTPVVVQQPGAVIVDPGYYDGGYGYPSSSSSIGGAIVSGIVSGLVSGIFDDDDDRWRHHHRPPPPGPHRPPHYGPGPGPGPHPGPGPRPPHPGSGPRPPERPHPQPRPPERPHPQPRPPERPHPEPRPPERPHPEPRPHPESRPQSPVERRHEERRQEVRRGDGAHDMLQDLPHGGGRRRR